MTEKYLKILNQKINDVFNKRKLMKLQINGFLPNTNNYNHQDYWNIKLKEKELKIQRHKYKLRMQKYKRLYEINKSNI